MQTIQPTIRTTTTLQLKRARPLDTRTEPTAEPVAARLEGVSKARGGHAVLANLDFAVRPHEVHVLLGANGAGKSTLVSLLLGLLIPDSGTVSLFGGDPRQRHYRAGVGVMLQQLSLSENLTVMETLKRFRSYHAAPAPLEELVARAGLAEFLNKQIGRLSGGQQRRVAFAVALAGRPKLLVLDEPTVGLDVSARRAIWREIRSFTEAGGAVLLTTHYLNEADALADRVSLLGEGRIRFSGSSADFKKLAQGEAETPPDLEDAFLALTETHSNSPEL